MLGKTKKIHFVGIGGAGMSGIAEFLHRQGFEITGSDLNQNETTEHLTSIGITITIGHTPESVIGADVVVKSSAVTDDNVEIQSAFSKDIPVIRRAEMLAELMRMSYGIAIAGTHGKTTTTSMTGLILIEAALQPTVIVGGKVMNFGSNNVFGTGKQIIVEADEFDRSFLTLSPIIAGITNIEADHLDCYEDLDAIKEAFIEFANKVPFFGCIVLCLQDKGVKEILSKLNKRIITYSIDEESDLKATDITYTPPCNSEGFEVPHPLTSFNVIQGDKTIGNIELNLYGEHNILNSLMAISIALELAIPFSIIKKALKKFKGVFRRCEYKGRRGGIDFYDDYAHHPTEIKATLKGLKSSTNQRIVAIFQPHLFTRTANFCEDFGNSFSLADTLIVTPIYPAREKPLPGVTGKIIADAAISSGHNDVRYIENNELIIKAAIDTIQKNDVVITIGAGDIYKYGEELMRLTDNSTN